MKDDKCSGASEKATLWSEVIKQVKDLFDLKEMGAITVEVYEEKKKLLLKDINWCLLTNKYKISYGQLMS